MTLESEITDALNRYGMARITIFLRDEVRISVQGAIKTPEEIVGRRKEYYQDHRDAIRKYQHEHYLRIRRSELSGTENVTFRSKENNNKMTHISVDSAEAVQERVPNRKDDFSFFDSSETTSSIVTHDQLASAMAYCYSEMGRKTEPNEFGETATQIMQFFGFEREVVGNHLEQDEIALMYQMEDIGLINTSIEEYTLMDGTPWRVNYFILNSEKIREFSSKTVRTNQDNASLVYENLPAEAWAR